MQVQKTTDYKIFKDVASNRDVDRLHVKKLEKSIREKNLLALNPIIVNEKMEVLDGQHRLEAAKKLKVEIYYVVSNEIHHDDISKLNSNKKNWTLMDYINYFTVKGVKEFKDLSKLINEFPDYPPTFLIAVASGDGSKQRQNILNGRLVMDGLAEARQIIGYIGDFAQHFDHCTGSRFLEAMLFICNTGLYDHNTMLTKLQRNPGALVPCANKKQYVKLLQEIYNKGTHEKNIVLFTKR